SEFALTLPHISALGEPAVFPEVAYDWSVGERCSAARCPGGAPPDVFGIDSAPIGAWILAPLTCRTASDPPIVMMRFKVPVMSTAPPEYVPISCASALRFPSIALGSTVYHQSRSLVPL